MSDLGETIELVFPYPYRFIRAAVSARYRAHVRQLYRANSWRWVTIDALVSSFFLDVELLLIGVVIYGLLI